LRRGKLAAILVAAMMGGRIGAKTFSCLDCTCQEDTVDGHYWCVIEMARKTMNEIIFLVEEAPEGGYTARALGQSIFTEADDLESLNAQVRAVLCHFDEGQSPAEVICQS
jgi:hypothetical protein